MFIDKMAGRQCSEIKWRKENQLSSALFYVCNTFDFSIFIFIFQKRYVGAHSGRKRCFHLWANLLSFFQTLILYTNLKNCGKCGYSRPHAQESQQEKTTFAFSS